MANHKSAKKRVRSDIKRNAHNRAYLSSVKTAVKKLKTALGEDRDQEATQKAFIAAQSMLSKASSKGMMHKNTVARTISRLHKLMKVKTNQTAESK